MKSGHENHRFIRTQLETEFLPKNSVSIVQLVRWEMAHITQRELDNLCETLYAADGDIPDIILFGSFTYSPSLAQDIDLVVTTTKRKDYGVYLDAVADFPINVDVIARQPREKIGDRIAWG